MELFAIIIIILIVVVVTLLGSLLKGAEEPPRPLRPMPGENRPRPMTEVDKFLEEINRLKRQAAGEQKSGPPPLPPPQAPLTPQPANEARRVEPLPSRMPAPRPRQSVPEPRSRPAPLRRPEAPPRPLRAPTPVPPRSNKPSTPEVLEVIPVPTPVETAPLTMHRHTAVRLEESSAMVQFRNLIGTPTGMQTAILLQEVLGPPRCRRRR